MRQLAHFFINFLTKPTLKELNIAYYKFCRELFNYFIHNMLLILLITFVSGFSQLSFD